MIADLFVLGLLPSFLKQHSKAIFEQWPIYLWPILAVVSAFWSLEPQLSAYHGFQLAATLLAGTVLAVRYGAVTLVKILFWSLLAVISLSLIISFAGLADSRDEFGAWRGGFPNKNNLGGTAVTLLAFSPVMAKGAAGKITLLLAIFLSAIAIYFSRSGTSLISFSFILATFPAFWMFHKFPWLVIPFILFGMLSLIVLVLGIAVLNINPSDLLLSLLGKDRTLSGRTVLWSYGLLSFYDHPWIGIGFKSYMASSTTTADLVQYILQQRLPYLHNNFLEVAVAFGVLGCSVFGLGLAFTVFKSVALYLRGGFAFSWSILFILSVTISMLTENPLFYNHSISQLLVAVICSADYRMDFYDGTNS